MDRTQIQEPGTFRLGAGLALAVGRPAEALAWYAAAGRRLRPTSCDLLLTAHAEGMIDGPGGAAPAPARAGKAGDLPEPLAAALPAVTRLLRRALAGEPVDDIT
ncbi:MAG TPA: hypothetical protein VF606_12090, partial [Geminicoccaceae bacterium]